MELRTCARRCSHFPAAVRVVPSVRVCLATLLVGCSDDPSSPPREPAISTLRVTVSTSGDDADTDGYLVIIDGTSQPLPVESNGSVTFPVSRWGPHGRPDRGRAELRRRWRFVGRRHHLLSGGRRGHGPSRHMFGVRRGSLDRDDHRHRPRSKRL